MVKLVEIGPIVSEQWLNFLKSKLGLFSDTDTPDCKRCKRSPHPACAGASLSPFVLIKGFIGREWVNNTAEPGMGGGCGVVLQALIGKQWHDFNVIIALKGADFISV